MSYISDILFWISTGLLVPVIVLLIGLFFRALLLVGSFFARYVEARKIHQWQNRVLQNPSDVTLQYVRDHQPDNSQWAFSVAVATLLDDKLTKAQADYTIQQYELKAEASLAPSRILSKMGPMLGLMGTLIPMGPALVGLSQGDIASMAYNMQVAFATTVVGLFAAAIGYVTLQSFQRWTFEQLAALDFINQLKFDNHAKASAQ